MTATASRPNGLASVIVPCLNQLEFTRLCIPALLKHTRAPWELIVVDNGSTDGTAHYLAGVRDAAPVRDVEKGTERIIDDRPLTG